MTGKINKPGGRLPTEILTAAKLAGMLPLDYMLSIMRDPTADQLRRDHMALLAAPYCHAKLSDVMRGKKDQQAEAAAKAGGGTEWADDLQFDDRRN